MEHIAETGERTTVYPSDIQEERREWEPLHGEGYPNASEIIRNIENLGFSSPRVEYVETPQKPVMKELAEKWGVNYSTLLAWARKQDWAGQRERYTKQVEIAAWEEAPEVIARVRNAAIERHRTQWLSVQGIIMEKLKKDRKIIFSPKGDMFEGELSSGDMKAMAAALAVAVAGEERSLGIGAADARTTEGRVDGATRGASKQIEVHVVRRDDVHEGKMIEEKKVEYDQDEKLDLPAIGDEYD